MNGEDVFGVVCIIVAVISGLLLLNNENNK